MRTVSRTEVAFDDVTKNVTHHTAYFKAEWYRFHPIVAATVISDEPLQRGFADLSLPAIP